MKNKWFNFALILLASTAHARNFTAIEFEGLEATKQATLEDLLPRVLPAEISEDELREFSRRVKNLGLFDQVTTSEEGSKIKVVLKHKSTLSPIVSFSSGKTLEDSSATLGLVDYDGFGRATRVGAKVAYAERGINFAAWIDEHTYSPNSWAREIEAYRTSSGFRFQDSSTSWSRNRLGGFVEWVTPFKYGSRVIYEIQPSVYYENFSNTNGQNPRDGYYLGSLFEVIYDAYKWDDLTPHGYKAVLELRPGYFTDGSFRGEVRGKFSAAHAFSDRTAFTMFLNSNIVNSGNVNHSILIGSQQGVRGLPDSLYRCSFVNYGNFELRHSIGIAPRWFLQPTLFADTAVFQPMNSDGSVGSWVQALSTGAGVRLVPTGLTQLLARLDVAKLHLPNDTWLVQFGITQYF